MVLDAEVTNNLAAFFLLQKYFHWSYNGIEHESRESVVFALLFLSLYKVEIPYRYQNRPYCEKWRREYQGIAEELAGTVRNAFTSAVHIGSTKEEKLLSLARHRQHSQWDGYKCISDFHDGAYECDFVSPYTKSAGNVDAKVMIMLQDWCLENWLAGPLDSDAVRLGMTPGSPTNKQLRLLLHETFGLDLTDVFATNLFPFVKAGGMSARIATRDLVSAARIFAIPQIRIVQPKLVICLGLDVYNALKKGQWEPPAKKIDHAIANPFIIGESKVWCQAHTSPLGQANQKSRSPFQVKTDWKKMKDWFEGDI